MQEHSCFPVLFTHDVSFKGKCVSPLLPTNGYIYGYAYAFYRNDVSVGFGCYSGYSLIGKNATCQDGNFTNFPSCHGKLNCMLFNGDTVLSMSQFYIIIRIKLHSSFWKLQIVNRKQAHTNVT